MKINVTFTQDQYIAGIVAGSVTVVIDVLRASTSMITALASGALKIIPVQYPEQAFKLKNVFSRQQVLLCGERGGNKISGFDLGNSPWEYVSDSIKNKILIFCSTNGTQLIGKAVSMDTTVLIGSIVNAEAIAKKMIKSDEDCIFACAGREGQFSLEDAVCAGLLIQEIRNVRPGPLLLNDAAYVAEEMYLKHAEDLEGMLHLSFHGKYLMDLGFTDDLSFCAIRNRYPYVPVFNEDGFIIEKN